MRPVNDWQTAAPAILVIDDNAFLRQGLADALTLFLGMLVYTAANGYEGVQIYQQQRQKVALVMMDMNMPVMNGEQTYKTLRQIEPRIRVIVSTSLSQTEVQRRLGARETPTFLQKPYYMKNLLAVVQTELTMVTLQMS
jgi:CheY-like chemotaxis protein